MNGLVDRHPQPGRPPPLQRSFRHRRRRHRQSSQRSGQGRAASEAARSPAKSGCEFRRLLGKCNELAATSEDNNAAPRHLASRKHPDADPVAFRGAPTRLRGVHGARRSDCCQEEASREVRAGSRPLAGISGRTGSSGIFPKRPYLFSTYAPLQFRRDTSMRIAELWYLCVYRPHFAYKFRLLYILIYCRASDSSLLESFALLLVGFVYFALGVKGDYLKSSWHEDLFFPSAKSLCIYGNISVDI